MSDRPGQKSRLIDIVNERRDELVQNLKISDRNEPNSQSTGNHGYIRTVSWHNLSLHYFFKNAKKTGRYSRWRLQLE